MKTQAIRSLILCLIKSFVIFDAKAMSGSETLLSGEALPPPDRKIKMNGNNEYFIRRGTKERVSHDVSADSQHVDVNGGFDAEQLPFMSNDQYLRKDSFQMHRRELSFNDDCPHFLSMGFDENTGSYGNMFDVQAKLSPIKITTSYFYTDLKRTVSYEVWTKSGSFEGYRGDIGAWEKLSEGSAEGQGKGMGTKIPTDNFLSVIIESGETRAFYITLTTPDIRYAYGEGYYAGEKVDNDNDHLFVFEGVGVASYPFDEINYNEPRRFLGGFEYSITDPCFVPTSNPSVNPTKPLLLSSATFPTLEPTKYPTPSPTYFPTPTTTVSPTSSRPVDKVTDSMLLMTEVEYINQLIHPFAEPVDFVSQSVSESIEKTIKNVISENTAALNSFANEYDLRIERIASSFDGAILGDVQCTTTEASNTCSQIKTLIVVSHLDQLKTEKVRHEILNVAKEASYDLPYTAYYKGVEAVTTETIISLKGLTRLMSKDNSDLFEGKLEKFLSSSFVKNGVIVTGFQIADQQLPTKGRTLKSSNNDDMIQKSELVRNLQSTSSLEVTAVVTGEHTPPPDISFDNLVSDTINEGGDTIVQTLQADSSPYFKRLQSMRARPDTVTVETLEYAINQTEPDGIQIATDIETPANKKKSNTGLIVGLCISLLILGFAIAGFIFMKNMKDGVNKSDENGYLVKKLSEDNLQDEKHTSKLDFFKKLRNSHVGCEKDQETHSGSEDVDERAKALCSLSKSSLHSVTEEVRRKRIDSEI